jgi:hypothetical protein
LRHCPRTVFRDVKPPAPLVHRMGVKKGLHQAGWRERLLPPGEKLIIKEV